MPMKFMSIQAMVDGCFAQRARVVRCLSGSVAGGLAMLVGFVAAEVLQLLDEQRARDRDNQGLYSEVPCLSVSPVAKPTMGTG